ncbi:MAG: hypothetical protein ACT4PK_10085, partial [Gammaproteobacteria bacterium]
AMTTLLAIACVAALAWANGANDNFKGVATLFGIGAVTGQARWKTIVGIFAAWLITLPLAALLGACSLRASLLLT